ncbi:putative transcriptional regulator, TetR family protein [Acrocarpospora phusangensis]|uniref:Transcriptional regulator, TetR family protein n=1 Tax=Acrocarpospora phusangensis TaxID=1070424 RepID=A0A919UQ41_9ACTN|nr:TetR family transcriptional regulator [Acrocarpospora phusangensis]GIH24215.1 putative transcriptional regulator, TetR family protein [Acrocarpospora phusangensis]
MHADLTARAVIRDRALELFAARGPDGVSVRAVAAAAGVSPALVIHHFGSKDGLRAAVDDHVAAAFDGLLGEAPDAASLAETMLRELPAGSPAYLRRLLLSGDPAGTAIFRRWYEVTRSATQAMIAAGTMTEGRDPVVRAAFLMVNDLVLLLVRDQLAEVLGVDPLGAEGMARWAGEALTVYREGIFR